MNNLTVAEVIAAYRRDRINASYISQQKADSIPGMRDLKGRKKKLIQKILAASINDTEDDSFFSDLKEIEQHGISQANGFDFLSTCHLCGGTGFLEGSLCECLRDRIYHEVYGATDIRGLTENFYASDHTLFNTGYKCANGSQNDRYTKIENYAIAYAKRFPDNKKPNLFLTGNTGLGKTFVLRSIAKTVHQNGGDVMLIGASELFSAFHRHRLGQDVELSFLHNCGMLLIDDLGVEPATQNVTVEYFLDLLNKRIDNKKNTVIASNLSADNIVARYGERVYSRIRFKKICDQLIFEGIDIRIK